MALWTLLVWVVIGALAGFVARNFLGGVPPFGKIGDIILGMAGAVVGGYVLALLGASGGGGIIVTLLTALLGAVLLIWLSNKIKK